MPPSTENQGNDKASGEKKSDYASVLKQVEEKVWQLWLEDLRREKERRGGYRS